jgi:DNA helicase-2/ATP-dependent DNA helicase PcrA
LGARIIDFKSSQLTKQKDADKRARESLQLPIYALAFKHIFQRLPDFVELHFLESGLVGRAKKSEDDLKDAIEKIEETSCGIRNNDFTAKPTYLACTYCAYSSICPSSIGN